MIPDGIHIAVEGEAVRTLGAWVGSGVDQVGVWSKTLDKVVSNLERWELGHPTMEGRRLIIIMVVGGMTQYLTKVQGMPLAVEGHIEKRVRQFLWAGKSSVSVNKETVYSRIADGGRNLLDIPARNEAIMVTWLAAYTRFGVDRPLWAYAADAILARSSPASDDNVAVNDRTCALLQSWTVSTSRLTGDLKEMVQCARKFGVCLDGIAIGEEAQLQMPLWYHVKSMVSRRWYGAGERNDCLKNNHAVRSVGDALALRNRLREEPEHRSRRNCVCSVCRELRVRRGCSDPNRCGLRAEALLNTLQPKWNPLVCTVDEDRFDEEGAPLEEGDKLFQPRLHTTDGVRGAVRIFPESDESEESFRWRIEEQGMITEVYTDGSGLDCGTSTARAGAGVYFGRADERNASIRLPAEVGVTNQAGEIVGAIGAAERAARGVDLVLISDSKHVLEGLAERFAKWEDEGYFLIENSEIIQTMVARYRERRARTILRWVKGHSGNEGNDGADALAGLASARPVPDIVDTTMPEGLRVRGAKLAALSQASAYMIIMALKRRGVRYAEQLDRRGTREGMQAAVSAAARRSGEEVTSTVVWRSIRRKDFSRSARYFL